MHHEIKKTVIAQLLARGWTYIEHPPFTAIASMAFQTATVPQNAVLYWAEGDEACSLMGQYFSEGRNVLEPGREIFRCEDSMDQVIARVDRFHQSALRAIDGSYARRLYLQDVTPVAA